MNTMHMKSKILQALSGVILAISTACAFAAPVTFTNLANPNPDQLIGSGNDPSTFSFTHSVLVDQDGAAAFFSGAYGFNSATDTITSATLVLRFSDESSDLVAESVALTFDLQSFGTHTITSGGSIFTLTFASALIAPLVNDGLLSVALSNAGTTNGNQSNRSDFLFLDSTLTVNADRAALAPPGTIPEPGSLALLGLGLAGLAFCRRHKTSN